MKGLKYTRLLSRFGAITLLTCTAASVTGADLPPTQASEGRNISQSTGRILSQAIAELNAQEYEDATATLQPLLEPARLAGLSPFEQSRVYQLSFNLNMTAENVDGAIADLEAALASGGLNAQESARLEEYLSRLRATRAL